MRRANGNSRPLRPPSALRALEDGLCEATAVLAVPEKYRKRLRTTNMLKRSIQEIRYWEKGIRIFLNMGSAGRLVGALCAETHEGGLTEHRYLILGEYFEWRTARSALSMPKSKIWQNAGYTLFGL